MIDSEHHHSVRGTMRTVTPIVALDVPSLSAAQTLVTVLDEHCDFYKVGLELFSAAGPRVVTWLCEQDKQVFVDLKLHDIPNTVRGAARSVAQLGASLLTVHASGGLAMMQAAVEGAHEGSTASGRGTQASCAILGVTVLTSLNAGQLAANWGRDAVQVEQEVVRLAGVAMASNAGGIVCSAHEVAAVHAAHGHAVRALVPGIRLAGGGAHDQERVVTPRGAAAAGAHWIILGRAVTAAADPVAAMKAVREELA